MQDKENDEEPAALHACITLVLPEIAGPDENGDSGHFEYIEDTDDHGFETIYQEHDPCIPAFEPYAIQWYKINQNQTVFAAA